MQGLVRYLYGPGRCEEHSDPHIVAGFRSPAELEPALRADGHQDFRHLDGLLTQPLALLGERNYRKPVWHLSVRAAPEDPILNDRQWAEIAHEMMSRTGLVQHGDEDAVRWIAVRHADDHVHIVATLARADGLRPEVWNDGYRIRDACRVMEARFGLRSTAPADRTAARRTKRAEVEKAQRVGRSEAARDVLRRHVATAVAGARTEVDFFAALRAEGVLVRERFSTRLVGQVTGYAVAVPDDLSADGRPVWFGGGKLASDLTLPKLRRRWGTESLARPGPRPLSGRYVSVRTGRAVLRTTVRRAADEARTTAEFLELLQQQGLLVRSRYSRIDPDQLTGYAVAFPDTDEPVWYTGGRLGLELALPRIQQRMSNSERDAETEGDDLTPKERQAFYDDAVRAAAYATSQIRRNLATDPYGAEDACWAASDVLRVAAKVTGNRHLVRAADTYGRVARPPYGRIPRPSSAGHGLRLAARLMVLAGTPDRGSVSVLVLVSRLIALLDAITQLRLLQQRSAQAGAARAASLQLSQAATGPAQAARHEALVQPSPFQLAMAAFPDPWAPAGGGSAVGPAPIASRLPVSRRVL
ncbi:relaxase/mobilization nuclease domain-containing protein [Actinomadura macra]|uniref:relaxase/mobilization nuclease domain-containing protein n=1 Tax=Actinomadura macra TaxID=46164 RepID=UPI0014710A0A|nr:hypothetical protein [Actinomadura macra]